MKEPQCAALFMQPSQQYCVHERPTSLEMERMLRFSALY